MAHDGAHDPLARMAYISLPDDFDYRLAEFRVDPEVALPIELAPEAAAVTPDDLTWDAAIAAMLKILAYQPQHHDAAYYRRFIRAAKPAIKEELTEAGIIKAHNGDFTLAEELFLALTGLNPEDVDTALNLAFAYEEHAAAAERGAESEAAARLRQSAERAYRRALELAPRHANAHLNLAHFYLTQRRFGDARPHLQAYLRHGSDPERRSETERLLRQMAADGLEEENFRRAYELVRDGAEQEGLRTIDAFLAAHPEVWQAHFLRGWALRRTGAYADAKRAFETVLAQAPAADQAGLADTHNELAICNLELRAYAAAERNLKAALQLDPENTKIISNMGILAMKRGLLEEARRYFETIRELDPKDPLAAKYLRRLGAGLEA